MSDSCKVENSTRLCTYTLYCCWTHSYKYHAISLSVRLSSSWASIISTIISSHYGLTMCNIFLATFLLLLAVQAAFPAPVFQFGRMTSPDGLLKRQPQGYYPELTPCAGLGNTCAQVCGSNSPDRCPSNTNKLACYSAAAGQHCCNDGNGR